MSVKYMSLVFEKSESTLGARLLLLAIADFADDHGYAWPSLQTLCRKARLSERNGRYALKKLQAAGELQIDPRAAKKGCNLYRIILAEWGGQTLQGANFAGGKNEHEGGQNHTEKLLDIAPDPSVPVNEPSITLSASIPKSPTPEEIYQAYPRKIGRGAALKAIAKALKKTGAVELLRKTELYAATYDGDLAFMPHAATWFNQERYEDNPAEWSRKRPVERNGLTIMPWQEANALRDAIKRHPANWEMACYNSNATQAQKEELAGLKKRLREISDSRLLHNGASGAGTMTATVNGRL